MNEEGQAIQLVERARQGDQEAFAQLVERYWAPLLSLARSIVGPGASEDAVQEGWIQAWRKLADLRDVWAFQLWLRQIVVRICLRMLGRRRRWVPLEQATGIPNPVPPCDPETGLDVQRLLSSLAPRQRAVMHLTVVEGRTDQEIAQILKIRPSSVRSHRRRARQSLARSLQERSREDHATFRRSSARPA